MAIIILAKPGYYYLKNYVSKQLIESAWIESKSKKEIVSPWSRAKSCPIGKISIGNVNLSYFILGGKINQTSTFGISHIPNTSRPGEYGNIGLTGSLDSFLKKLEKIHLGDIVKIEHLNGTSRYKVNDIQIVSPEEMSWLNQTEQNLLTLITYYPFDYIEDAPMRYIIRANQKLYKESERWKKIF